MKTYNKEQKIILRKALRHYSGILNEFTTMWDNAPEDKKEEGLKDKSLQKTIKSIYKQVPEVKEMLKDLPKGEDEE